MPSARHSRTSPAALDLDWLSACLDEIEKNAAPLAEDKLLDDEHVHYARIVAAVVDTTHRNLEWSHSTIERTRFTATTIEDSAFDHVVFRDCDFSGLSFVNCFFNRCLIVGARSSSLTSLHDCILQDVVIMQSELQGLALEQCRLGMVTLQQLAAQELTLRECAPYRRKSQLTINDGDFGRVVGLELLRPKKIEVSVDSTLWRELGDAYLRSKGMSTIETADAKYLERIGSTLDDTLRSGER